MAEPILIGTRGWEHPEWQGGFYPEELPPDWRFCYYSNWFRGVLVPAETWGGVQAADVREWVEDSDPEFRFVLELPAALSRPAHGRAMHAPLTAFFKTVKPIRPQIAGVLVRVAGEPDAAWLEGLLDHLGAAYPVCVDLPAPWRRPEAFGSLARHAAGLSWRAAAEPAPHPGGRLMVALSREAQPKAQRHMLEALARWQGENGAAALIFDDPLKAPERARQARALAELMGV